MPIIVEQDLLLANLIGSNGALVDGGGVINGKQTRDTWRMDAPSIADPWQMNARSAANGRLIDGEWMVNKRAIHSEWTHD